MILILIAVGDLQLFRPSFDGLHVSVVLSIELPVSSYSDLSSIASNASTIRC